MAWRHLIASSTEPRVLQGLIGPLFGVLFFFLMFDPRLLNPAYIDWLLPNEDSRMQLIGWSFFRTEPWHLPPGAATQYGLDMGGSIVFTDAIPLFAFIFKIFRSWLPEHFQYMGLWILGCYMAQGAVAWLLSGEITQRLVMRCVIVAFFVTSPIMLNRAVAHHALMGHWLLLAALYLHIRPRERWMPLWWCLLLAVAALVNAYLLYMTTAIWAANLCRQLWIDRVATYTRAVTSIGIVMATLLCTMWAAGYFAIPMRDFSAGVEQYGRFAANLNSFWNPLWFPTVFFSPQPLLPGSEIEGSSYLGVGIMTLVPIAVYALVRRRHDTLSTAAYVPLAIVALGLCLLGLSHRIAWGDRIILTIPLPPSLLTILGAIRSSARMLWVAYYGLTLAVLAIVATRFRPAVATTILLAGLSVQVADAFPRLLSLRQAFQEGFAAKPKGLPSLTSPFWQIAPRHYRRILFVPVAHKPPGYDAFALFAAGHGMAINVGYFARVSNARIEVANATLHEQLSDGPLRQDSVYVFWNGPPIEDSVGPDDGVGVVDGFPVLAPRWFEFDECCREADGLLHHRDFAPSQPTALNATAGVARPTASGHTRATISASPNPVHENPGRTTLTWSTGGGSEGEVYVSINGGREILFAGASSSGSQAANWIGFGDRIEFRLYAGKAHAEPLAAVLVTGERPPRSPAEARESYGVGR
jgi:hypothetical protein